MVRTHIKNSGEIAPEAAPKDAKTCFVFRHQYNAESYPAPILIIFEIKDVTWYAHT